MQQSATDSLKTSSKGVIQKTAEPTGVLVGNKIVSRITRISKNSQRNNLEIVTNEHNKKIPKTICISRRKTRNY